MKKLSLHIIASLTAIVSVMQLGAQNAPQKETVLIDRFDKVSGVPMMYVEVLRDKVIRAFLERGRNEVIDAVSMQTLAAVEDKDWTSGILWQSDYENRLTARATGINDKDIRYVISGAVLGYEFEHKTIDDKPGFRTTITLALTGYDRFNGRVFPIKRFSLSGEDLKADKADAKAIDDLRPSSLEQFIDENIKFECDVLESGPANHKGVVKVCYIHCGSDMGVRRGDLFLVYAPKAVGGVATREQIGRLRVKEVQTGEVSLCVISGGREKIAASMRAGESLIAISDGQALFH